MNYDENKIYTFAYVGTSHQTTPYKKSATAKADMSAVYRDYGVLTVQNDTGNPIVPGTPDVNAYFEIYNNPNTRTVKVVAYTDGFPSYEGYYSHNGSDYVTLYKINEESKWNMAGSLGDQKLTVTVKY